MKIIPAILLLFILTTALHTQDFSRSDSSLDVIHYRLELYPDIDAESLVGSCSIKLRFEGVTSDTVALDAVGMSLRSVKSGDGTPLGYRYDSSTLYVSVNQLVTKASELTVIISYETEPAKGMHFVAPNASYPQAPRQFWTHNQPDDARYWFPCHDVPWDKATSEIIVYADSGFQVISNGELESVMNEGSKTRWHWQMKKRHSTYLIALAGGTFLRDSREHKGIPIHSYFPPGTQDQVVDASYSYTPAMMSFFETYCRTAYPWQTYAQVPLHEFPYGGMENTTATFLSDDYVLMDMRARQDYTDEHLIAHELAHQWWGDLVTCGSWEDMWINEGFATYMQQLWTRFHDGTDEYEYQRFQGKENILRYLDTESPLTVRAHQKNSAHNLYTKAAAILAMILDKLGEDVFVDGLEQILQQYAHSTISTDDLIQAFEQVSGKALRSFVIQWLDRSAYPIVEISYKWREATGELDVVFHQESSSADDSTLFIVPVTLGCGREGIKRRIEFGSRDSVITIALSKAPEFVEVDQLVPAAFKLSASPAENMAILRYSHSPASRIVASRDLIKDIERDDVREALFDAARNDSFYACRFEIANALTHVPTDSGDMAAALKNLFLLLSTDRNARVRATAYNGLSSFSDASLIEHFRIGLLDSSYHVAAAALNALAMIAPQDITQLLGNHLKSSSYKDILASSAMPWIPKLAITELDSDLLRLFGPGHSQLLRYNALRTLLQLKSQPADLAMILGGMINEPELDIRYLGASGLAYRYPKLAISAFRKRLEVETNPEFIDFMQRFIEKGESAH
jgi:aminopeptidase N